MIGPEFKKPEIRFRNPGFDIRHFRIDSAATAKACRELRSEIDTDAPVRVVPSESRSLRSDRTEGLSIRERRSIASASLGEVAAVPAGTAFVVANLPVGDVTSWVPSQKAPTGLIRKISLQSQPGFQTLALVLGLRRRRGAGICCPLLAQFAKNRPPSSDQAGIGRLVFLVRQQLGTVCRRQTVSVSMNTSMISYRHLDYLKNAMICA
jgi:hypothetical protein